jgi:hypothetical protein
VIILSERGAANGKVAAGRGSMRARARFAELGVLPTPRTLRRYVDRFQDYE